MRVLVIDDNKDITDMIADYLESIEIECKTVNGGREGLHALKTQSYDVVFMDLAMPEFRGLDILNELKKENLVQSKNIVVITASSVSDSDIQSILDSGAKAVLRKPLSVTDFTNMLDKFR